MDGVAALPLESLIHDGVLIEYTVVRSRRRRRTLSLTLDSDGHARVSVPMRTSRAQIRAFVARSAPWIVRKRAALAAAPQPPKLTSGASLLYLGHEVTLEIATTQENDGGLPFLMGADPRARPRPGAAQPRVTLDGGRVHVNLPATVEEDAREEVVRLTLARWYRAQAAERLVEDTARWAETMGVEPRDVRVRDQRRRWGSCGADGTIRFNFRLMMTPPEIIDYVVVHELAHLRVPNHSRAFWAEVARFLPDYVERRGRLNKLGARGLLPF